MGKRYVRGTLKAVHFMLVSEKLYTVKPVLSGSNINLTQFLAAPYKTLDYN